MTELYVYDRVPVNNRFGLSCQRRHPKPRGQVIIITKGRVPVACLRMTSDARRAETLIEFISVQNAQVCRPSRGRIEFRPTEVHCPARADDKSILF